MHYQPGQMTINVDDDDENKKLENYRNIEMIWDRNILIMSNRNIEIICERNLEKRKAAESAVGS